METTMKKSLIFIAMLALATTLFAENEKVSCESDSGKCSFERSGEMLDIECICRNGKEISYAEETNFFPDDEECLAQLDGDYCHDADYICENEAGNCTLHANGEYFCTCLLGVFGAKTKTGTSENFSAEGCTAALETECGMELATTPRTMCTDSEILNACVSYEMTFTNTCFEPVTEEEIETILDTPVNSVGRESGLAEDIAYCCLNEVMRNIYKTKFECVEAAESCENKECCETCDVQLAYLGEEGANESDTDVISPAPEDEDTANTEAPTTGTTPEDTADGDSAPATDSEVPAEKEESKSDGCSMLFL